MGLSKSSKYYASHPEARRKKNEYNSVYESSPQQRKYRSKLSVLRKKRKLKGNPKDLSHQKNGSIVLESRSINRGRQGADGRSTLK